MRVGVIRGDLPGPIFLADLEPSSQLNYPTEPVGQSRYVGRPDLTTVTTALSTVPAALDGTSNITFPLTVAGGNHTLLLRTAATGSYTAVTIANATYASLTTLLVAVNAALVTAGVAASAIQGSSTIRIRFVTTTSLGAGASIGNDTIAHGSTGNTILGLVDGAQQTVPTAASTITSLLPVGGPLDVSSATVASTVSPGISAAQVTKLADAIAPQFVETSVALSSYQVGTLAGYLKSSFTPDANRLPVITPGAAITVVQDDGTTVFSSSSSAPKPNISGASVGGGNLTITGTGLGSAEYTESVIVKATNPATGAVYTSQQLKFVHDGGSVSATSLVVPQSDLGGVTTGWSVQVKFRSLASNAFTVS